MSRLNRQRSEITLVGKPLWKARYWVLCGLSLALALTVCLLSIVSHLLACLSLRNGNCTNAQLFHPQEAYMTTATLVANCQSAWNVHIVALPAAMHR